MRLYTILEKMINKLGIDWIIESNTIDDWTVEKWYSGKMVQTLWLENDSTGWSDIPYSEIFVASNKTYTFPQTFVRVPVVLASVTGGNGLGIGTTTHPNEKTVRFHVTGSQSCTKKAGNNISIIAIGKYK